jgi:hypothetical protein
MYVSLLVVFLFLLNARIQHGPEPLEEEKPVGDLPDTWREVFRRRPALAAAPEPRPPAEVGPRIGGEVS